MTYVECKTQNCGNKVFATRLCRKHYEKERRETAAPCLFEGCSSPSDRRGLCMHHYRKQLTSEQPECSVPGCTDKRVNAKQNLCPRHYQRVYKYGSVAQTRSGDWGSRQKHSVYSQWTTARRYEKKGDRLCVEWYDDFWAMANTVGEKPEGHYLKRIDPTKALGPDNWRWHKPFSRKKHGSAAYSRHWRRKNPRATAGHDLKRVHGLSIDEYERMLHDQKGVCKICGREETAHGKDGGPRRMAVDHDHETGRIRGLLCSACNRGIGLLKDSPEILRSAIRYLNSHKDSL